jgi:hypothetical protein
MNECDFELVAGSGNVFRDLGDPLADLKQAKAIEAARVISELDDRGLSVCGTASLTGFEAADFSRVSLRTGASGSRSASIPSKPGEWPCLARSGQRSERRMERPGAAPVEASAWRLAPSPDKGVQENSSVLRSLTAPRNGFGRLRVNSGATSRCPHPRASPKRSPTVPAGLIW